MDALKREGIYIRAFNKRLSKGMAIDTGLTRCLEFDTSAGNFLSVDDLVPTEAEGETDAGGGD